MNIALPKRSLNQNDYFHGICRDISRSGYHWAGRTRTTLEWKTLIITAHTIAAGRPVEIVPNLEDGSPVQLRESSSRMTKERSASLIEYATAWAIQHGIPLGGESEGEGIIAR